MVSFLTSSRLDRVLYREEFVETTREKFDHNMFFPRTMCLVSTNRFELVLGCFGTLKAWEAYRQGRFLECCGLRCPSSFWNVPA